MWEKFLMQDPEYPFIDFVVNVEENKDITVLHLTDIQIIDEPWSGPNMEVRGFSFLRKTITEVKPDLIIITGDLVYGRFDHEGTSLETLIEFMEGFGIPWAPVFGNHDNESRKGADWQSEQLEKAEHCLFLQRTLRGNGNYTVAVRQGDQIQRVFFMLDSNGCWDISDESRANGHSTNEIGFGSDQIEWYTDVARKISEVSPRTKFSVAFHIQPMAFADAFAKYGFKNENTVSCPINIDAAENLTDGDFGYLGSDLKSPWDADRTVWNGLKKLGIDSVFVGHEHCNSASVVYEGVRCQYGQKSTTYDRANYRLDDGTVVGTFDVLEHPIVGGTVVILSNTDGSIKDSYIFNA